MLTVVEERANLFERLAVTPSFAPRVPGTDAVGSTSSYTLVIVKRIGRKTKAKKGGRGDKGRTRKVWCLVVPDGDIAGRQRDALDAVDKKADRKRHLRTMRKLGEEKDTVYDAVKSWRGAYEVPYGEAERRIRDDPTSVSHLYSYTLKS